MFNTQGLSLLEATKAITHSEPNIIANLANVSSLVALYTDRINWAGFYLLEDGELVLGPFQGKPACVRIPMGKGVCGAAAERRETILVEDVHEFPGHIACDSASLSEIVVPIIKDGKVLGVLDIDSPERGRFSEEDKVVFEGLVKIVEGLF